MSAISKFCDLASKVRVWGLPGIIAFFRRSFYMRLHRRRLEKMRRSSHSRPRRGITVIGDMTARNSTSKTLRDFVLCLRDAGIPFQTYDTTATARVPRQDSQTVLTPPRDFDFHRYSHFVSMFRSPLTKEMTDGHTAARIVFHESEHGVNETMPYLRESGDAIIAMSDFNCRCFKKELPGQRVCKITYPFRFRLADATPRDELRDKFSIPQDAFAVFFNFDFGSYYRKNIPAAMKAFSLAFKGDMTTRLVFKTKGAGENPREAAETMRLADELGIAAQFIHITQYIPRADMDGLTGACDIYMSLHKSEGFGLGMAEAMSQGVPVVATGWSANTEFCRPDTAWCIPYRMTPILPNEYPPSMKEWAEPDAAAAAKALREIRQNPAAAAERAEAGRRFMKEHFSLAKFKADVDSFLDGGEK